MKGSESANIKGSKSFLERFQGRRSSISKEGLHHLFDKQLKPQDLHEAIDRRRRYHRENEESAPKDYKEDRKSDYAGKERTSDYIVKDRASDHIVKDRTSRHTNRTEMVRSKANQHELRLPKLPRLFNSVEQNQSSHRNQFIDRSQSRFKLDKIALQHLEFLNKFEQKIEQFRQAK